jgi:PAS domain S-box-containing protein
MSSATARLALAPDAPARASGTRVWRPFPREVADILTVEDRHGDIQPRMYPWFGITLVRSPAVVTGESRRCVVANRNWVALIPAFHLHGLRAHGAPAEGAVTLLLGGAHLEGLGLPAQAALVTDPGLGEEVAALIAQLLHPVRSVEHATAIRSALEQLLACSAPLPAGRIRRTGPLAPVRTYLKAYVSEPAPTEVLARMSGLSECHMIQAFHYEFGLPPHAYHLRLRLAVACELLSRGLAVAGVAYECGFADQSHLSRKFKALYGLTPAAWAAAVASKKGYDVEAVAGTDISGSPSRDPRGSDSSERATPDRAEEWEARYRALLEQTSDGVLVCGAGDRRILRVNDAACRISRYSREELLAMRMADLFDPGQIEPAPTELPAGRARTAASPEQTLRSKDGRSIAVALNVCQLDDGTQQAVVRDLSEFRAAFPDAPNLGGGDARPARRDD